MIGVEKMRSDHVAQVADLEKNCFSDPWSEKSIASELENPLSLWLVATEGEHVVGYVGSQSVPPEADVMNVAVSSQYRRQGVARRLLEALMSMLQKQGITSLSLEVRASNAPAVFLYEKLGFIQVGCRKNYYSNPKEDAWILRKEWEA